MANQLIKSKTFTPGAGGQPYRAPQPARTGYVTQKVCGYKGGHWGLVGSGGGGGTAFSVNDEDYTVTREEVTYGYVDDNGRPVAYSCWNEQVPVHYPADPGQQYIPASPDKTDYHLGWDSGARSLLFVTGDSQATFHAGASNIGAICGLNSYEEPLNYTGATIRFGWYLARGAAKVVERGSFKTGTYPYGNDTEFKISRVDGVVTYAIDGTVVYTSSADGGDDPLWLQAALYSGDDEIFDPVLSAPEATEVTGTLTLTLPPVCLAARQGTGGVLRLGLPQPGLAMGDEAMAAPAFAMLNLVLPPVAPSLYGLTGIVGQLALSLPQPSAVLADKPLGRLSLTLPGLLMRARNWPLDELPFDPSPLLIVGRSGVHGIVTLPTKPMKAVLSGSMDAYAEVTLSTVAMTLLVGGSIDVQAETVLATVPMTLLMGGSLGGVLSSLNEVFALNITGGKPGGTTQYENYPFNSVAKIGGRYYGASEDGLHLLEGEDDAGQPIEASFGLGQMDFGSPQIKTVTYCYLGAAAGGMRLELQALLGGGPAIFRYPARGHGRSMRELRFDLGRGLRSSYVMPTFYNCGGAPFEVDAVRFMIAESARRI